MKNREKGSILIISIWILVLLSLMASSLAFYAMLHIKVLRYRMDQLEGRYLAAAGVRWTMYVLTQQDLENYEASFQKWALSASYYKNKRMGDGKFSVSYEEMDVESKIKTRYGIVDEERKININTAPKQVLLNLPEASEEIVDAIVDWRDQNSSPEPKGAEKDYYEDLDIPYPAKNAPLEHLSELLLVKGMTQEILKKWGGLITLYGDGKVNINTASTEVLQILGLDEDLIEKIVEYRKGPDELLGTDDDGVFADEGAIARTLFDAEPLSSTDVSQLVNLVAKGLLGVKSKHFLVQSFAMPSGSDRAARKVEAVVEHVQGDEVKIIAWREE
ncbi:MAG: general secretion pathway protein GspK [Chlamydiae bacterium]|nr:general secretion pathway protein GspK [Chlamydiota bacterium]MBI3267187.1 general secretion pathway protein GspK [Chlamydiota bacterium]